MPTTRNQVLADADVDLELRRLETLKLHHAVQRFFEISPIHGCSYIGFHKAIYEAVFWALVMCVSTGLCVNDVVTLVTKFGSQATSVSVNFQRNSTMNYSDAAICFDIFRDSLQNSISSVFVEKNFNATLQYMSTAIGTTTGSTDLSLLNVTDPNIDLIMKTAYLLIAAIVDYDLGTPGGGNAGYDNNTWRAVQLVQTFFQAHGYATAQLYEQTARFMCNQLLYGNPAGYFPIRVVGLTTVQIDLCGVSEVTWVGYTMAFAPFDDICFAMNTPAANLFRTAFDTIVIDTVYIARLSWLVSEWTENVILLPGYGRPHMIFEMRGWRGLMDPREMDSICLIGDQTGFLVGVQIDSQFQAFNHSWGTCGKIPFSDCALWNCLPAARIAADGCWPLAGYMQTSSSKPASTPVCSRYYTQAQITYLTNLPTAYTGQWEKCIFTTCTFPPCQADVYLFETSYSSYSPHGANATLYQAKLNYAILQEYVIMDFNAFLAALGGSMGLWLGSSIISLLHVPIFVLCAWLNGYMSRRLAQTSMAGGTIVSALAAQSMLQVKPTLPVKSNSISLFAAANMASGEASKRVVEKPPLEVLYL